MEIVKVKYPNEIPFNEEQIVLAMGFFDGVHLGHQEVIRTAKTKAAEQSLPCAVMTFNPHPREVLGKQSFPYALTPPSEKMEQFKEAGVDLVYIVHFDMTLASVLPKQFVEEILLSLNVNTVVVGFNYTFGHKGSGTVQHLREMSNGRFEVEAVGPVSIEGEQVSSTLIRERLLNGQVDNVSQLLGRPYLIKGEVIHGEGRGKQLGFPTANLSLSEPFFIPKTGVYAVRARYDNRFYDGVMNIGYKPTFHKDNKVPSFEVHLLDEVLNLYNKEIEIEFIAYIRSEKKFEGIGQLVDQIKMDCSAAKLQLMEWKIK